MSDSLYERLSGRNAYAPLPDVDAPAETTVSGSLAHAQVVKKRLRNPIVAAVAVSIIVLVAAVFFTVTRLGSVGELPTKSESAATSIAADDAAGDENAMSIETSMTLVHVVGAVKTSGVYELELGARVVDAIEAAGGASEDAALASVNLARIVTDGEQLRIPTAAEAAAATLAESTPSGASDSSELSSQLININTASAQQLEELPRVGPALAGRIIDYRTANGGFRSVDDLNAVSGIGEKLLESIRALVTV